MVSSKKLKVIERDVLTDALCENIWKLVLNYNLDRISIFILSDNLKWWQYGWVPPPDRTYVVTWRPSHASKEQPCVYEIVVLIFKVLSPLCKWLVFGCLLVDDARKTHAEDYITFTRGVITHQVCLVVSLPNTLFWETTTFPETS